MSEYEYGSGFHYEKARIKCLCLLAASISILCLSISIRLFVPSDPKCPPSHIAAQQHKAPPAMDGAPGSMPRQSLVK